MVTPGRQRLRRKPDSRTLVVSMGRGKKLLYSLILLIIPLLVFEIGLRIFFALHVGPSVLYYGTSLYHQEMQGDASIRTMSHRSKYWKYYPHQIRYTRDKENGGVIRAGINSFGFRGHEFDRQKPADVIRVATLGASSTFGFSVRDAQTYPYFLEQILNQRCHPGERYEVINLGIPHLKSDQLQALFCAECLPLNPDIVTFYEGVNDSWNSPIRESKLQKGCWTLRKRLRSFSPLRRAFPFLRDHFVAALLIDGCSKRHDVKFLKEDFEKHIVGKSEKFVRNVAEICTACQRRNIRFIVISQQAKSFHVPRETIRGVTYQEEAELVRQKLLRHHHLTDHEVYFLTHQILMQDLKRWAIANQASYIDGIRILNQRRDVLVSWVHLNAEGNRMLAEAIATEILAQVRKTAAKKNSARDGLAGSL
jgi:hypothetical protein